MAEQYNLRRQKAMLIPEVWSNQLSKSLAQNLDRQVIMQAFLQYVPDNMRKYIADVTTINNEETLETHIYFHFKNGHSVCLRCELDGCPLNAKEAEATMAMVFDLPHRDLPDGPRSES